MCVCAQYVHSICTVEPTVDKKKKDFPIKLRLFLVLCLSFSVDILSDPAQFQEEKDHVDAQKS